MFCDGIKNNMELMSRINIIIPVTDGMHAIDVADDEGRLWAWEFKSSSMHRGILVYRATESQASCDVEKLIRVAVLDLYKPGWNRGFAFGVLVQFDATAHHRQLADFDLAIDAFNNSKGVWQWIIAVDTETKVARARHMWMEGSLHGHFKNSVSKLTLGGFSVTSTYAERPAFFAGLNVTLKALTSKMVVPAVISIVGLFALSIWLLVQFKK
jgi:hypothetical protein